MPIKGVNRAKRTYKGKSKYYYYTGRHKGARMFWKSDKPLDGARLPAEFIAAYHAAIAKEKNTAAPDSVGEALAHYFETCPKFRALKPKSKKTRKAFLERWMELKTRNGDPLHLAPIEAMDDRKAVRKLVEYRDATWAPGTATSQEAQFALSAFLNWAVSEGRLDFNRIKAVPTGYKREARQNLWTPALQNQFLKDCPAPVALGFRLALFTGLRLGDLIALNVNARTRQHLIIPTSKSRGQNMAIIPLIDPLADLLDECAAWRNQFDHAATTILTNARGRPWTADGFKTSFYRHRKRTGIEGANAPSIHDLRKTAATEAVTLQKQYPAITDQVLVDWFGWSPSTLAQMRRIYVNDDAVISAITGGQ